MDRVFGRSPLKKSTVPGVLRLTTSGVYSCCWRSCWSWRTAELCSTFIYRWTDTQTLESMCDVLLYLSNRCHAWIITDDVLKINVVLFDLSMVSTYLVCQRWNVPEWYNEMYITLSYIYCILYTYSILYPASAPQLVQQRLWYVLSCLWDGAYKRTLAVNQKA